MAEQGTHKPLVVSSSLTLATQTEDLPLAGFCFLYAGMIFK